VYCKDPAGLCSVLMLFDSVVSCVVSLIVLTVAMLRAVLVHVQVRPHLLLACVD
jgi:hypothetical protein